MGKEIAAILLLVVAAVATQGVATGIDAGNEPPLADAGLDQTVDIGGTVLLDGGGSRDPDGEIETFRWEITAPDGSTAVPDCPSCERTAFAPTRTGVYTVNVTVTDDDGASQTDTLYVTVEGAAGPTVSLTGPGNTDSGTEERYRASVDAGDARLDELVWRVDGTVVRRDDLAGRHAVSNLRWTFDDSGQYELSVTAYDDDGRHATDSLPVTVDSSGGGTSTTQNSGNDPPSVRIVGPDRVDRGDYEVFTAVANDSDGVVVTYDWFNAMRTNLSDPTRAGHHFTAAPGEVVVIGVTVTDNRGATATATKTVRINPEPEVTIEGVPEGEVNACNTTSIDLTANATGFGGEITSYSWDNVDSSDWKWAMSTVNYGPQSDEAQVSVQVTNTRGLTASDTTTIDVKCENDDPESNTTDDPLTSEDITFGAYTIDGENVNSQRAQFEGAGLPMSDETLRFRASADDNDSAVLEFTFDFGQGTATTVSKSTGGDRQATTTAHQSYNVRANIGEIRDEAWGTKSYTEVASVTVTDEDGNTASKSVKIVWVNAQDSDGTYDVRVTPLENEVERGDRAGVDVAIDGRYEGAVTVDFGDGSSTTVSFDTDGDDPHVRRLPYSQTKRVHHTYVTSNTYSVTAAPQADQGRGKGDSTQIEVTESTTSAAEKQVRTTARSQRLTESRSSNHGAPPRSRNIPSTTWTIPGVDSSFTTSRSPKVSPPAMTPAASFTSITNEPAVIRSTTSRDSSDSNNLPINVPVPPA